MEFNRVKLIVIRILELHRRYEKEISEGHFGFLIGSTSYGHLSYDMILNHSNQLDYRQHQAESHICSVINHLFAVTNDIRRFTLYEQLLILFWRNIIMTTVHIQNNCWITRKKQRSLLLSTLVQIQRI